MLAGACASSGEERTPTAAAIRSRAAAYHRGRRSTRMTSRLRGGATGAANPQHAGYQASTLRAYITLLPLGFVITTNTAASFGS